MLEFIKGNINWIKDIATLIFAGTATIIGVLTYNRARATILQPIRSEVIKRQSELLSKLLLFLKENNQSFENGIDYVKVVQLNVLCSLRDYGFVFKGQEDLLKRLTQETVGWIPCGSSNVLHDVEIIGTFKSDMAENRPIDHGKEKYDNLKYKKIDIDKIYQTNTLVDVMNKLSEFSCDPFMPKSIQKTLGELLNDINYNLVITLKAEIEKFMLSFSEDYFKNGKAPEFNPIGVYNEFNHIRIHHRNIVVKLRKEIRKYLLIDEPW